MLQGPCALRALAKLQHPRCFAGKGWTSSKSSALSAEASARTTVCGDARRAPGIPRTQKSRPPRFPVKAGFSKNYKASRG
jgi:hypothetical protein